MRKKNNEYTINDVLQQIFNSLNMEKNITEHDVIKTYHGVVGNLISKLTRDVKVRNRVLYLQLSSAALKNELSYKKQDLINRINTNLNCQAVDKIIFL